MVPQCHQSQGVGAWKHCCKKIFGAASGATTSATSQLAGNFCSPLWAPSAPEEDSPFLCITQTTSAILQTPNSFLGLVGRKAGQPAPFSKKPPPTGLAGYNGPPKECFPLHALSPPPIAEQRDNRGGKQRGYIPLALLQPLAGCLLGWLLRCLGLQADSGSRSAEAEGFPTADLESAGREGTKGFTSTYLTS